MKKSFRKFPVGSAEYVVLHAKWAKQRGKRPSLAFMGFKEPKQALRWANSLAYFPVAGSYLFDVSLEKYVCSECGASRVKLWRPYQSFKVILLCADCACKNQEKDVNTMDDGGRVDCEIGGKTDQIGWYVPAVPSEESTPGDMIYWGYTAVPGPGVDWWKKLPNWPVKIAS
jgi:hypothetical protein